MLEGLEEVLITTPSIYGKRIAYQIWENDDPLDSSNVTMGDWERLAGIIAAHYEAFDAFVVIHGTDTMAYTASALAFQLENLSKTVILTGSQIPFSESRNDAQDNLLGALTIAGHYCIPEVGLYFANKLFRGCRATKFSATEMQAFDSPNCKPLAHIGVNIEVDWLQVMRPIQAPFRAHQRLERGVGVLRFFPGISPAFITHSFGPEIRGMVLQTFGAGNIPTLDHTLLSVLKEASDRGVIMVNCTQCYRGTVLDIYATGRALMSLGVLPGFDMTTEGALTKLAYLLGREDLTLDEVRQRMMQGIRGELTRPLPTNSHHLSNKPNSSGSIAGPFNSKRQHDHETYVMKILPALLVAACAEGNVAEASSLVAGMDPRNTLNSVRMYDGRNLMHVAASQNHIGMIDWLINNGVYVDVEDGNGVKPVQLATHPAVIELLKSPASP